MISPLKVQAYAKVNLSLLITGRRPDGYHLLDSHIVFSDISDEISFVPSDNLSLLITGPFSQTLGNDNQNLVLKAAEALASHSNVKPNVAITLLKKIPVAAGLGGGSADAAATLIGLNQLWDTGLSPKELMVIGRSLGADVPVCVFGRSARVRGIGDQIEAFSVGTQPGLLLINPGIELPTAEVFARRCGAFSEGNGRVSQNMRQTETGFAWLSTLRNDLEKTAQKICPEIKEVLTALAAFDSCIAARLSGSGPTCFGIFKSRQIAAEVGDSIKRLHPSWWIQESELKNSCI